MQGVENRIRRIEKSLKEIKKRMEKDKVEDKTQNSDNKSSGRNSNKSSESRYGNNMISSKQGSEWSVSGRSSGLSEKEIGTLKKKL